MTDLNYSCNNLIESAEKDIKTIFITVVYMFKTLGRGMKSVKSTQTEFLEMKTIVSQM